uniref:Uncharacterized protein n=1 Tax=Ditylenchus dipsaci TaxID=166011 RepID=A0A915D6H8_9BILA
MSQWQVCIAREIGEHRLADLKNDWMEYSSRSSHRAFVRITSQVDVEEVDCRLARHHQKQHMFGEQQFCSRNDDGLREIDADEEFCRSRSAETSSRNRLEPSARLQNRR